MSGGAQQQHQERDRYTEANVDIASHIGDKIIAVLRTPENQSRMQSLFDPIVSHIINRVFPYILLSAILFLILFVLTIGTFWMVMRTSGTSGAGGSIIAHGAGVLGQIIEEAVTGSVPIPGK
jgi:hypothetical protein